mgnify:CR=1 FL=1
MSRDGYLPPGCTQRECDMTLEIFYDFAAETEDEARKNRADEANELIRQVSKVIAKKLPECSDVFKADLPNVVQSFITLIWQEKKCGKSIDEIANFILSIRG